MTSNDGASSNGRCGNLDLPELRHQDPTPITKQDSKRSRSELIPINEFLNIDGIQAQIETSVEKSFQKFISLMNEDLLQKLKVMMDNAVNAIKTEVNIEMASMERRLNLKMMSEAEMLESYNRRDNIRVLG